MMDALRAWLSGVCCAALLVTLVQRLLPKGKLKNLASLTGGLILLLAVVQPLLRVRWEELTWRYETYQRDMDRQTEAYQAAYADSLSGDIADRTAAYISEQAAHLGLTCRAEVRCEVRDGTPQPASAAMDIPYDARLAAAIADDLGIPAEKQSWQGGEAP